MGSFDLPDNFCKKLAAQAESPAWGLDNGFGRTLFSAQ
jgi:hypothetical protein